MAVNDITDGFRVEKYIKSPNRLRVLLYKLVDHPQSAEFLAHSHPYPTGPSSRFPLVHVRYSQDQRSIEARRRKVSPGDINDVTLRA